MKQLTEQCNSIKEQIDVLKNNLDKKKDERQNKMKIQMASVEDEEILNEEDGGAQEIIDEEELIFMQKLKEVKRIYRKNFNDLKTAKNDVSQI